MLVGVADTHVVIWYIYADPRLSTTARDFIRAAAAEGNQIGLSSITFVEMVYLIEKARIPAETLSRVASVISSRPAVFIELPVDLSVARALSHVDSAQVPDMPDRIIAATAYQLGVPLISRDRKIQLSNIETIW